MLHSCTVVYASCGPLPTYSCTAAVTAVQRIVNMQSQPDTLNDRCPCVRGAKWLQ